MGKTKAFAKEKNAYRDHECQQDNYSAQSSLKQLLISEKTVKWQNYLLPLKTLHNHAFGTAFLVWHCWWPHLSKAMLLLFHHFAQFLETNCGILCRLLSVRNHCLHLTLQIIHSSKNFQCNDDVLMKFLSKNFKLLCLQHFFFVETLIFQQILSLFYNQPKHLTKKTRGQLGQVLQT